MKLLFLLLFLSCQTIPMNIDKPKDYSDSIREVDIQFEKVQSIASTQYNPELQRKMLSLQNGIFKITNNLKDCEKSNKLAYESYIELQKISNQSQKIINDQDVLLKQYETDFFSPKQKKYFIWIAVLSTIGLLVYTGFVLVIKGIIKF